LSVADRAPASESVATHCPYCSLQCGITLTPTPAGMALAGQADFPTNLGGLCAKGFSAAELLDHPDRLTTPLVRGDRSQPLRSAT
jgi:assimilatory nitrate reductase catalytic subunit